MARTAVGGVYVVLTLFTVLAGSGCQTPPPRVPWMHHEPIETDDFIVYLEPNLAPEIYRPKLKAAGLLKQRLIASFFPAYQGGKINLILYKNRPSYNRYRLIPLETIADYERRENRINISLEASAAVWKHELSHAILESVRKESPYWLQEGLALFMQSQNFRRSVQCDNRSFANLPPYLQNFLPQLRKQNDLTPGQNFDYRAKKNTVEFQTAQAGYFIYFLWDTGRLTELLQAYQFSASATPEFLLTKGNIKTWLEIHDHFKDWLQTERPRRMLPGC